MLGLAHVLVAEALCDREFLARCTVGFEVFEAYLLGRADGVAKTPEWAAADHRGSRRRDPPAGARASPRRNAFVMLTWSLQRAEHGEQPYWMAIALAAMLGGDRPAGRGFGFGYGSMGGVGFAPPSVPWAAAAAGPEPGRRR